MSKKRGKQTRICQRCRLDDTHVDDMKFELVGIKNPQKKFYHEKCFEKHMKLKEFKEQERKELDILAEKIKEIYGLKQIPNTIFPFLQDLRNGNKFFGKYDYNYKKGYPYDLIAETFEFCASTIEYWNGRKQFNGATHAIRYGLAIVCDKIHIVDERRKKKERDKILIEQSTKNNDYEEFESNYKKPKRKENDISQFLDD